MICLYLDLWNAASESHTSYYVGIPLAIIAIVSCLAFAVLAMKHKRLSSSFARFANPRYDNRSGTATLGNTDIMGNINNGLIDNLKKTYLFIIYIYLSFF